MNTVDPSLAPSPRPPRPPGPRPLTRSHKVLYALGTGSGHLFNMTVVTWAMYCYLPPPGSGRPELVSLGLFTMAMTLGRILDAVIDPAIGWYSDRTRVKVRGRYLGRRIPFILLFGLPAAVTFCLLWVPPDARPTALNGLYFAVMINLYFVMSSLVYIPQGALLPEIAVTSKERVSLAAHNALFTMICAVAVAGGAGLLIERFGFRGLGLGMGLIGLLLVYAPTLVIRERPEWGRGASEEAAPLPLLAAVRETFRNGPFVAFAVSMFFYYLGFNALMAGLPYFVVVILRGTEGQVPIYLGAHVAAAVACFPAVTALAGRIGKRRLYTAAYLALALMLPALFFVGKFPVGTASAQALVFMIALGAVLSVHYVLPGAVTAECVDHDEKTTGRRREASYFGVQSILQTTAIALSSTVLGLLFRFFGYSAAHPLGIYLLGPVAGLFLFCGYLSFRRYTLN